MTDASVRLRCACGWETRGAEEEVIAAATEHGARVHNMRPTRDEVLAMVVPDVPAKERSSDSPAAPRTHPRQ
jgi:predicted small metal-binding protein